MFPKTGKSIVGRFSRLPKGRVSGRILRARMAISHRFSTSVKRILLYTDSRGDNLPEHNHYQHYGERLAHLHYVDAYLCPEKWTTILDFLHLYESMNRNRYDFIILHAGAVDAAPRQQKVMLEEIYPQKKALFDRFLGKVDILTYLESDLNCEFEGDKTINMYSLEAARQHLIPLLKQIPNLIWINSNPIVPNWRGNYWRDRPGNVRIIEEYSDLFSDNLDPIVDLRGWSLEEVKLFTFDNIHPNKEGSDLIFHQILNIINGIANRPQISRLQDEQPS